MKLENKVAIVTGGASGIGEATVRLFAEEGAQVVIADFSDRGQALSDELNANGFDTLFVKTDVTKEEEIKHMISETVNKYGKLDIMYANAGVADDAPAHELTYEKWKRTIDINLSGVFLSDKYAIEQFQKQGTGGVIVNAGSIHSFVAFTKSDCLLFCKRRGKTINTKFMYSICKGWNSCKCSLSWLY